ncbi:glycerophosphodiester phosphodiesterase [Pelomonas sp. CA6]|uniref:glycerophosphodiester phosphodiesterase n=1 Tax=Pelomonas sp. CA6 TaxID=2907999 RepID=UPI001F4BFF6B|nr:glycerophosphodiester phosphodiesterase [Pelomonas sp. CA6]MCH7344968.1 glycerophosphodiester phosphodiesterase [Pelomonas sp. CA6]
MTPFRNCPILALSLLATAGLLSACGGSDETPLPTLDGRAPLVVGHRGASGYLPEHTLESYTLAIQQGADVIEPDLVSTKDGVLVARHEPMLSGTTDVASRPEFAARKTTKMVDGDATTDWFVGDFTLAELKTLYAKIAPADRPQGNDGKFRIPTLQEIIDLAKAKSRETGRTIAIYPETKHPTFHIEQGLPLEDRLVKALVDAGWNSKEAPVFVQSFEPGSLKALRAKGLQVRMVQLIDADWVDFMTGQTTYDAIAWARPYDWTKAGDTRLYSVMVTPAGLAEIKTYADGIGPWKPYIASLKYTLDAAGKPRDMNGDGKLDWSDASSMAPTSLVADAHKAGLFVHAYTFRNEKRNLAYDFGGDPQKEYLLYFRTGLDGLFSDFPDTAVAARGAYLKEMGH